jgi:hypothetical protein
MNASRQNDLPRIRTMLAQGADVKAKTAQGQTALYEAIERTDLNADNLPIVAALLQAGADPNEKEIFGASALSISLTRDYANPSVTLLLLEAGAIVPHECPPRNSEDSLVSLATMDSSVEVMRELISKGGPVNCKYRGASALYWAALNGQADRVELLLQSGADPREQYDGGHTIVDIATTTNRDSRVQKEFAKTRQLLEKAIQSTAQLPGDSQKSAVPEPCRTAPGQLGRTAIDILRVEAISTQPTDGTYSDEGYGQGEFDTVKLLEVLKSPIHWKSGHVFRVHPFPGKRTAQENFSPEHLAVGNSYILLYTYSLDKEPKGEHDLIGLTRCGVFDDTPAIRRGLLDSVGSAQHSN